MRTTGRSNLIDLEVCVYARTEKAWLVSGVGEDANKRVWVPLSQIEVVHDSGGLMAEITLPEWLAIEKELV